MKIYNKSGFLIGLFYVILGTSELIMYAYRGFTWLSAFLYGSLVFFGITKIVRSLSGNMSAEDLDERNEYIRQKTGSTSFTITKILCFAFWIFYMVIYNYTKNEIYIGIFIIFAIMFIAMCIIQLIVELYYDHHS
ncbi:MAG: hypothetical protein ACI4DV_05165 [Lachnospiraceae bacterium]